MAFLTLEDLVGTVEVIVFPKDYAVCRSEIYAGNKVLIRGRASVGVEEQGKLIAEKILGFDQLERELWVRFRDFGEYKLQEKYLMSLSGLDGISWISRPIGWELFPPLIMPQTTYLPEWEIL